MKSNELRIPGWPKHIVHSDIYISNEAKSNCTNESEQNYITLIQNKNNVKKAQSHTFHILIPIPTSKEYHKYDSKYIMKNKRQRS